MFLFILVLCFQVRQITLKSVLIKDTHLGISPDWIIIVLKVNRPRIYNISQIKLFYTSKGLFHLFVFLKKHMFYI